MDLSSPRRLRPTPAGRAPAPMPGALSERYESGGRGPGTVSSGQGDPGGVSYGLYQLASRTGTVADFLAGEGAPWSETFAGTAPGTPAFSAVWQAVAAREPARFAAAQHAFIARTHYQPLVAAVLAATGLDLSGRSATLRDVAWSTAVQHGAAARIVIAAVAEADRTSGRADPGYDAALVRAIYAGRSAWLQRLAGRLAGAARETLHRIVARRYPAEQAEALARLAAEQRDAGPAGG